MGKTSELTSSPIEVGGRLVDVGGRSEVVKDRSSVPKVGAKLGGEEMARELLMNEIIHQIHLVQDQVDERKGFLLEILEGILGIVADRTMVGEMVEAIVEGAVTTEEVFTMDEMRGKLRWIGTREAAKMRKIINHYWRQTRRVKAIRMKQDYMERYR